MNVLAAQIIAMDARPGTFEASARLTASADSASANRDGAERMLMNWSSPAMRPAAPPIAALT